MIFKKRVGSPQINLAASMDQRSNNEVLNIGDQAQRLVAYNLENADLFHTASVETRNGTIDISNGIGGYPACETTIVDLPSTLGSGLSFYAGSTTPAYDYAGFIIVPSGDTTFKDGSVYLRSVVDKSTYESNRAFYDSAVSIKSTLWKISYTNIPASGAGFISGTSPAPYNGTFDIALSGTFTIPPYPQFFDWASPTSQQTYVAKSDNDIEFSYTYNSATNNYEASGTFTYRFPGPAPLYSGQAYWLRFDFDNSDGSATARTIEIQYLDNPDQDPYPNVRLMEEFYYVGSPANRFNSLREIGTEKSSPVMEIHEYCAPGYLIADFPEVKFSNNIPVISGSFAPVPGQKYLGNVVATPPSGLAIYDVPVEMKSAWVGQYMTLTHSGLATIYGGYHYAGLRRDATQYTQAGPYIFIDYYNAASGTTPKTVQYEAGLFQVNAVSGTTAGSNLNASADLIASFSGTINFNDENKNINSDILGAYGLWTNYHLNKVYSIFDNPISVASGNYIYAVRYFDDQGRAYQDCSRRVIAAGGEFASDIMAGFNLEHSGCVLNWNGDDSTFISPTQIYQAGTDLACGLISVASGNGITLLYDYRYGSDLNQKVIIGQSDKLYWTNKATAEKENWTVIHSGAAVGNDKLWSALTFNNLLFAHQYGQSNGQVWDSTYSGVSYDHGKRPTFTASGVSASGSTLPSGTYNIVLATSMDSGGFRSSVVSGITIASGQWIHIDGLDMQTQYPFDLSTQSTYVFITEPSGSIYYLPTLYDAASLTPTEYPQPIANNITGVYINTPVTSSGDTVLNALDPAYPQTYLLNQIDTPRFKKMVNFFNYIMAYGDDNYPSKLYYSDVLAPQIWSLDGQYGGSYDIEPDNGQPITAMETIKQYLVVFKKNSTYRVEYTDNAELPWSVINISPNIGCLGTFSTVNTEKGIFGLSQFGPFVCNGNSVDIIGQEILPWFQSLNHDDLTFSYVIHDQTNQVITWSIANNDTNEDRNFALVFNYKEGSWSVRRGQAWNCAGIIRDEDGFDEIWIGDSIGTVKRDNVGNTDSDTIFNDGDGNETVRNIQLLIETPWMSFNGKGSDSNLMKLMRFLQFNVETAYNSNIAVEVYYDYETSPRYTRVMPIGFGNSNKRINLGGQGKIVKFKIYNTGEPNKIKINKLLVEYQELGPMETSG